MKLGILQIATGSYINFFEDVYKSFEKYFMMEYEKTYFLFTDSNQDFSKYKNLKIIKIPWGGFPKDTLYRFHYFLTIKKLLIRDEIDVLYYCDVDMKIVSPISNAFLPSKDKPLIAVTHPFFFNRSLGTPENRPESKAYIDPTEKRMFYICGGIAGGLLCPYLSACEIMTEWIDIDAENDIVPRYEDEGIWNRYMVSNQDIFKFYPPSYCYPTSYYVKNIRYEVKDIENVENKENLKKQLPFLNYKPIILCIDKDHEKMRRKPESI